MTNTFKIVDGDVVINNNTGQPVMVQDREKLRQDVRLLLSQDTDEDGFGAGLDRVIGVLSDPFIVRADIAERIRAAVASLQSLQSQYQLGARTAEEVLLDIARLTVSEVVPSGSQPNQPSRTSYTFELGVTSRAGGATVTVAGGIVV